MPPDEGAEVKRGGGSSLTLWIEGISKTILPVDEDRYDAAIATTGSSLPSLTSRVARQDDVVGDR